MEAVVDFLLEYYVWVLVVLVILLITVIGFLVDTKRKKKIREKNDVTQEERNVDTNNFNNANNNIKEYDGCEACGYIAQQCEECDECFGFTCVDGDEHSVGNNDGEEISSVRRGAHGSVPTCQG